MQITKYIRTILLGVATTVITLKDILNIKNLPETVFVLQVIRALAQQ